MGSEKIKYEGPPQSNSDMIHKLLGTSVIYLPNKGNLALDLAQLMARFIGDTHKLIKKTYPTPK
ncbi:hypothetical protein E2C01_038244 [Portunus trituberculatus]|uniref:Uncharacterized protein n=1 Tax=Portunus trituberculatus TaxID=210409 RepID=A0A5B7FI01_PORTR|nr:hypothetical protein [Portunus trituberculatus]